MITTRNRGRAVVWVTLAMLSTGCGTGAAPTSAGKGRDLARSEASSAMPVSTRDRREQKEFEEAIRGLSFDRGVVDVRAFDVRDARRAAQFAAEGAELLEHNRTTEAIKAYADAVRSAPDLAESYRGLGNALNGKGKTDHAIATFRTAIELDPNFVEATYSLAYTLSMADERDEAIEQMRRVIELDPTHAKAHERLAIGYYYAEDYGNAWRHTHAAQDLGHVMPPQFLVLLDAQAPER